MPAVQNVYSVCQRTHHTPLSLGQLTAFANAVGGGELARRYRFVPGFFSNARSLVRELERKGPGVLLFSHYMWNTDELLAISEHVARRVPGCVTIHGGPSVPTYEAACAEFMSLHPHVDIAVRGEGEGAFVDVLERLAEVEPERGWDEALGTVRGITFRSGRRGAPVRTPERPRLKDLSVLPSPYLAGAFDSEAWIAAVIETNRGCPYGCTYCDWGSATLQKIHLFPLERVKEEIDWIGRRRIPGVYIADANFGIFERDLEIAEHVIRTKEKYGYPRELICLFAKSSTDRVTEIARRLIRARLIDAGRISIQTTDAETLAAVRRSNIKTSRYLDLRRVYAAERLPIATELIIGMPQQTVATFKNDLQFCFDQRTYVSLIRCIVLPNSPMAEPEYLRRYGIEVDEGHQVVSTSTLSRQDIAHLELMWRYYYALVDHAVLRYLLAFMQRDYDLRAVDVLERLVVDARSGAANLAETRQVVHRLTKNMDLGGPDPRLAFYRWERLYSELRSYFVATYGIADDSALAAILNAQRAVMPSLFGAVPKRVSLPHDVAAYFRDGDRTGRLASYPEGVLEVTDPLHLRWALLLSLGRLPLGHFRCYFELRSPLSADVSHPHFFQIPEVHDLKEALTFAGSLVRLTSKRAKRFVDTHQNMNRTLRGSLRALFQPAAA